MVTGLSDSLGQFTGPRKPRSQWWKGSRGTQFGRSSQLCLYGVEEYNVMSIQNGCDCGQKGMVNLS